MLFLTLNISLGFQIFIAIFSVSVLGFVFGLILSLASRFLKVKVDERIEKIYKALPGSNCGACGFAGCFGYAENVVNQGAEINLCPVGGSPAIEAIAKIMGVQARNSGPKMVAAIHCIGDNHICQKDYKYNGSQDCLSIRLFFGGNKTCKYGCLGEGTCMEICPVNAIKRDNLDRIYVDSKKCIGCKKCVSVCPVGIIHMIPEDSGYFVACQSHDPGKIVKKVCSKGCIACKICQKNSENNAYKVEGFLATIDYGIKEDLSVAAIKCPVRVIIPLHPEQRQILMLQKNEKQVNKN